MAHIDSSRALWTTRNPERSDLYAGFAREPGWPDLPPTMLEFRVRRELRAADFASQSLRDFMWNYCDCQHPVMKSMLHAWMRQNKFDAVVRLNTDPDEVVLANPAEDLLLTAATPL